MLYNIHQKFIKTPIANILQDAIRSCLPIGYGIETQALCEYIMQTTFLKMTGASEQKLKCIVWEIATYDYNYRYKILSKSLGECSQYKDKKRIYDEVGDAIKEIDKSAKKEPLLKENEKIEIAVKVKEQMTRTLSDSLFTVWLHRDFTAFNQLDEKELLQNDKNDNDSFLGRKLKDYYETKVYRYRNRCAHNLRSYQDNLPTFLTLSEENYEGENYFKMFFVLILMDELYMQLYERYLKGLTRSI